jgi:hypothetical protein
VKIFFSDPWMILSGDNKKLFVDSTGIYKIGEGRISRYDRGTFDETHSSGFPVYKAVKEADGCYYACTEQNILKVYRNLLEQPVEELRLGSGASDFHVYSGQLFSMTRNEGSLEFYDEGGELLIEAEDRPYLWSGALLYVQKRNGLHKYDLVSRKTARVAEAVDLQCLTAGNDVLVYASKGNVIHYLSKDDELTFHSHPKPILGLALNYSGGILAVCKNNRLTLAETRRNDRRILSSFNGRLVDFQCSGTDVFVLTTFSLLVYDLRSNCVAREIFNLPKFFYLKLFGGFPDFGTPGFSGREIFTKNVERTKVAVPYIYDDRDVCGDSRCIAVAGSHAFEYSLGEGRVRRVVRLEGQRCYFSRRFLIGVKRSSGCILIGMYSLEEDGLVLVKTAECRADLGELRDVVYDGGWFYLLVDEGLYLLRSPANVERTRHVGIKSIVECKTGVLVLDKEGISMLGGGEYVLTDTGIKGLRVDGRADGDVLYVNGDGISMFKLEDDATEEDVVEDRGVVDFSVLDGAIVVLAPGIVRRYRSGEVEEVPADGRICGLVGDSFGICRSGGGYELHRLLG